MSAYVLRAGTCWNVLEARCWDCAAVLPPRRGSSTQHAQRGGLNVLDPIEGAAHG